MNFLKSQIAITFFKYFKLKTKSSINVNLEIVFKDCARRVSLFNERSFVQVLMRSSTLDSLV